MTLFCFDEKKKEEVMPPHVLLELRTGWQFIRLVGVVGFFVGMLEGGALLGFHSLDRFSHALLAVYVFFFAGVALFASTRFLRKLNDIVPDTDHEALKA